MWYIDWLIDIVNTMVYRISKTGVSGSFSKVVAYILVALEFYRTTQF